MALSVILAVIGVLLLVISLAQPLAGLLRLPFSVLLAAIGMLIAAGASFLLHTDLTDAFDDVARAILDFPIGSTVFLYVFLPTLVFQTALTLDVRQMIPDWVPIFVLAVVAVIVATVVIGFALLPFAGQPLLLCLLVGAIVATTDPVAVVGIFRDIGAPARLGRLVEGESLLNDAAAITLFSMFLAIFVAGETPGFGDTALSFLWTLCGGALVGHLAARAAAWLIGRLPDARSAAVSISFALAYLVFIACEQLLGVSGVIAVVVAGMTMSLLGPSRASPDGWSYLTGFWDQVAFWASSLVFVLAAILVPRLLASLSMFDFFLILVVAVAALLARGLILFLLLPLLSLLRLSPQISIPYRVVILWGGLRGAVTLALALSVTEHDTIPDDIQRFVAILATGFVLFTLLIQGTTMRWVISSLGLNLLSPRDAAMRGQVLAVALENVREAVANAAELYKVSSATALAEARRYAERIDEAASAGQGRELTDKERLSLGLLTLAGRERELIIERMRARTVSTALLPTLLAHAETLLDRARTGGWQEYQRAAKQTLAFGWKFGLAQFLHRRLHASGPLERLLARRFELLFVVRTILEELDPFIDSKIVPILGMRVGEVLHEIVHRRQEAVDTGLDALRLQYPLYAESLERRLLRKIALRQEELEYTILFEDGLIGPELYDNLRRSVDADRKEADRQRRLDLAVTARELVSELPLFADLTGEQLTEVTKLLQPLFVIPGEQIIRRGAPGDAVYFIASGALEVSLPDGRKVRLGRGDVVGEMALLHGLPRQSDVHAISYCFLLRLDVRAFQGFLERHPGIRQSIEQVAAQRAAENAEAVA